MNNPQEVAKIIKEMLYRQGKTAAQLTETCGLSKNALSSMQSSGYLPRIENIVKIADYLGVSVDYLLGRQTPELPEGVPAEVISGLPESEIISLLKSLSKEDVLKTRDYIQFLLYQKQNG